MYMWLAFIIVSCLVVARIASVLAEGLITNCMTIMGGTRVSVLLLILNDRVQIVQ